MFLKDKIYSMLIKGKYVTLRAIEQKDLALLHEWHNDPDIAYQLGGWHFPGSLDYLQQWFLNLKDDVLNQRFAIDTKEFGLIGTANLVNIDWKNNNAFHGMMLGNKNIHGKGLGTDTIMAIMRYAFEELHLERLDGSIIAYNEISQNVYLNKCGWKKEGIQRNWYYRKNQYWDRIMVGATKDDYAEIIKSNQYWIE